jgi:multidrug transporter EmrE-like cation transporter
MILDFANNQMWGISWPRIASIYHPVQNQMKTMTTPASSIACFVVASILGAWGQFLYKSGAERATEGLASYLLNARILGGIACYVAVMVLFVAAFKRGGEMTVLYPVYAATFIWASLISLWAFGTPIKPVNVLGMACLVAGMYFMGR